MIKLISIAATTWLIGILIGFTIVVQSSTYANGRSYNKAKQECEQELPHKQECVMYFKPGEINNE